MAYGAGNGVSIDVDQLIGTRNTAKATKGSSAKTAALPTKEDIQHATTSLLRRLVTLTQCMSPLPKKRDLVMKLAYYQDVTPADYKPVFFETSYAPLDEPLGMESVQVGSVVTPYHSLSFTYVFATSPCSSLEIIEGRSRATSFHFRPKTAG